VDILIYTHNSEKNDLSDVSIVKPKMGEGGRSES